MQGLPTINKLNELAAANHEAGAIINSPEAKAASEEAKAKFEKDIADSLANQPVVALA